LKEYDMPRAFVLMTALPPTKGHFNLMNFASHVGDGLAMVIVCTQPNEPYAYERVDALGYAAKRTDGAVVHHLHRELPQDPETPGFWEMWDDIMRGFGFGKGDIIVSSEPYGLTLANRLEGTFIPYDPERKLYYTKATNIRENMTEYFHDILPEFQKHLMTRITVFGGESTGKTTLGHWVFEYARPYLENVTKEINVDSMTGIWKGQNALQRSNANLFDKPFIVQDTDLYSTIGYWEQPHWTDTLGPVPEGLIRDAEATKSDLYIITKSNIPFEEDPIRYGGDHRESDDDYWIGIAKKYNLPYVVLESEGLYGRLAEAGGIAKAISKVKAESIYYDRGGF
jgi:HTH-type transcriptional repressor of NAD biosynthesis genes